MEDVGVHCLVLALHPQARGPLDHGAVGKPLVRLRADQHSADRGQAFEPCAGVHRAADERVRDVALATDLDG